MLLAWCLLPAAAFVTQPAGGVGGRELSHGRTAAPPAAMAARSKEAEANIKKWGKILSQADTFDDSAYLRKGKGAKQGGAPDKQAGGGLVAAASLAIVLAMVVASAGTAPG